MNTSSSNSSAASSPPLLREKEDLVKLQPTKLRSVGFGGKEIVVSGKLIRTARFREEWYEDVADPASMIRELTAAHLGVDIFTFWQRLPDTKPQYAYYMEPEPIAAVPISTFDYWWNKQLNTKTRNVLRKAQKAGVVVQQTDFDDRFIAGMSEIFNETPVRQDKPFWHYGKDAGTIKREFSRYLFREDIFGAYHRGALIGFSFLAYAGKYALLGQIISKIEHREKAPNNALIAKAVEVCATKQIPYLVYSRWSDGGLVQFKKHNGFEKFDLPRYYVPITAAGAMALKLNLHHGIGGLLPTAVKRQLVDLRRRWYTPSTVKGGAAAI